MLEKIADLLALIVEKLGSAELKDRLRQGMLMGVDAIERDNPDKYPIRTARLRAAEKAKRRG